jgi:hypothetical protein
VRQRSTLGNIRRSGNTLLILFVAPPKPSRGGIWHPSVMQFYSGPLMHFLSGVDRLVLKVLRRRGGAAPEGSA